MFVIDKILSILMYLDIEMKRGKERKKERQI